MINTEVAVLIDSAALGERLGVVFDEAVQPTHAFHVMQTPGKGSPNALSWVAVDDGKPVRHDSEPASAWRRVLARVLSIFTPDDQL